MFKFLFSKKKNLAVYNENRMSPFDAFALEELVSSFGRNDLTCLEIGSWFGAGSTQIIGKFSKDMGFDRKDILNLLLGEQSTSNSR